MWQRSVEAEATPWLLATTFTFLTRFAVAAFFWQILIMTLLRYCYIVHWERLQVSMANMMHHSIHCRFTLFLLYKSSQDFRDEALLFRTRLFYFGFTFLYCALEMSGKYFLVSEDILSTYSILSFMLTGRSRAVTGESSIFSLSEVGSYTFLATVAITVALLAYMFARLTVYHFRINAKLTRFSFIRTSR